MPRMSTPSLPLPPPPVAPSAFKLRAAELRDVQAVVGLIRELAEFEQLTHLLQVTPEKLRPHLFGEKPVAEALVAELDDGGDGKPEVVAFALFFTNFSTFIAQPGLYLEDLFVRPVHRGRGIGGALLRELGRLSVARGCGRFEWSVLDWNEPAIGFYKKLGAKQMDAWRIFRVWSTRSAAAGRHRSRSAKRSTHIDWSIRCTRRQKPAASP